jgi:uncharacterized spore protein YtfJ
MTRLRSVELYRDGLRRVIAIETVALSQHKFGNTAQLYAAMTPVAVVVCRPDGHDVLAVESDKSTLDTLRESDAELNKLISRICGDEV